MTSLWKPRIQWTVWTQEWFTTTEDFLRTDSRLCFQKNWREHRPLNLWNPGSQCKAYDLYEEIRRFSSHLGATVQQFELPNFHSAWHQNRNAVSLKKEPLLLIFSSITILSMRRHVYTHVRLVLEWKERAFKEKVNSRCFCWFPAAILVDQSGPPIWRLHTKLYKVAWNVSANNSQTVGHKDPRLGQIVYILVFYNISSPWLPPQDGFQFIFRCVTVKTIYWTVIW